MNGAGLWQSRFIGRSLRQNRLRSLLTVLGIALGVAILLAINLANAMALANFKDSLDRVAGPNNLTVRPLQSDRMPQDVMGQLAWLWRIDGKLSPVLEQTALWPGSREVVNVIGLNLIGGGREDVHFARSLADPTAILRPGYVWVGARLAEAHGLNPGDRLTVLVNDRQKTWTVAAVLTDEGLGGAYSGHLILMDMPYAQAVFGMEHSLSRLDLRVPPVWVRSAQKKLRDQLPESLAVQRPERRGEQVDKMLRAYRYNLTTLSFIALLVGVFLIYNTMSITIIRRRPEIGTMRAIGVGRWQIFRLFLGEALMLGTVGTALGLGLGVVLARFASQAVNATVATLYTGQVLEGFAVPPGLLVQAALFGLLMTVLGAMAPVLEATAVAPAEASRRASYETRVERYSGRLAVLGMLCLGVAGWAALQPPMADLPVFGFASALFVILGAAFLMPAVLKGLLTLIVPVLHGLFGIEGRLAGLTLKGALGRTAVAVASLMIGIAMMVSLAVMIGSFRETVIAWVNQTLRADLWVDPVSRLDSKQTGRIDAATLAVLRTVPGVAAVDAFYEFPIEFNGNPTNLGVGDFDVLARYGQLIFLNGESTAAVVARTLQHPAVIVTESFANRNGVRRGDRIQLHTPTGPRSVVVEGVYYDYASDLGYIVMPRPWYRRFYRDDRITNAAVYLAPGQSAEAVRGHILARLQKEPDAGQVILRSNQELRKEVLRIFDRTFAITYALHVIAIAVALLAVMNSLFALVLEARRDFGILKYLGASRGQIARTVLVQAGLLGVLGNGSGLLVGLVLSVLLIEVINKQSFGWTIQFALPTAFLVQSFLLVLGTAILSGWIPARLAARTPAPEVVRWE